MSISALCVAVALLLFPRVAAADRLQELLPEGSHRPVPLAGWWISGPFRPLAGRIRPMLPVFLVLGTALVVLFLAGPLQAVAAGLFAAVLVERRRAEQRHRVERTQLVAWERSLDDAASSVRAGAGPAEVLGNAEYAASGRAGVAELLHTAHAVARLGGDSASVLAASSDPVAVDLAAMLRLTERHGVPLGNVLESLREEVATRRARAQRVDASLAGPRATALILTALPVLGILMGSGMGADPLGMLGTGLLGGVLCVAGALFLTAGLLWTDRIIEAARR